MIGVTLHYKWITKNVYILPMLVPGPGQRPAPRGDGGGGIATASFNTRSFLDSYDTIQQQNTQSVVYYFKK